MSVNTRLAAQALPAPQARAAAAPKPDAKPEKSFADKMSVGFEDLIDVVNPLQQVPGVSAVYREVSGDDISIPSRLAGGFLFGGPMGLAAAAGMVLFEEVTGDSVLGHLSSLADELTGESEPAASATAAAAPALPYLKDGAGDAVGAPPSAAAMAEALKRKVAATAAPETVAGAPTANGQAPETLARLYALQATDFSGAPKAL